MRAEKKRKKCLVSMSSTQLLFAPLRLRLNLQATTKNSRTTTNLHRRVRAVEA